MRRPLITYRTHRCNRSHRSYRAWVKCAIRGLAWVDGEGPYASISYCKPSWGRYHPYVSVMLFKTEAEARGAIDRIDEEVCGGSCRNDHKLVRIIK